MPSFHRLNMKLRWNRFFFSFWMSSLVAYHCIIPYSSILDQAYIKCIIRFTNFSSTILDSSWVSFLRWIRVFSFFDLSAAGYLYMPAMLSTKEEICRIWCPHGEADWRRPASDRGHLGASSWCWCSWSITGLWSSMSFLVI